MKKKDFITLIMSTVGGILFALGMCMALLPEWGAMMPGIVIGVIGAVVLLSREPAARMGDTELKVAETTASIVGRQMEQ